MNDRECDACGGTGEGPMPPYRDGWLAPACSVCGGHGRLETNDDER